ncbi:hypothetical protein Esti_002950 [Eimeria stiedai]
MIDFETKTRILVTRGPPINRVGDAKGPPRRLPNPKPYTTNAATAATAVAPAAPGITSAAAAAAATAAAAAGKVAVSCCRCSSSNCCCQSCKPAAARLPEQTRTASTGASEQQQQQQQQQQQHRQQKQQQQQQWREQQQWHLLLLLLQLLAAALLVLRGASGDAPHPFMVPQTSMDADAEAPGDLGSPEGASEEGPPPEWVPDEADEGGLPTASGSRRSSGAPSLKFQEAEGPLPEGGPLPRGSLEEALVSVQFGAPDAEELLQPDLEEGGPVGDEGGRGGRPCSQHSSKVARFAELKEEDSFEQKGGERKTVKVLIDETPEGPKESHQQRKSVKLPNFFADQLPTNVCAAEEAPKNKIQVVSFSAGRIISSALVARENLEVSEKKKFVPEEKAREFITNLIQEFDKVESIRRVAVSKCTALLRRLQTARSRLEYFEKENEELHKNFERRVREFKEQMPETMQQLDAQWQQRMEELRGIILSSQQQVESLQEQQDEVLQQLEAFLGAWGLQAPESGSSSRERVAAFVAALKKIIGNQQQQDFKACVRLLVEQVAASTYERQLKREKENSKQAAAAVRQAAAAANPDNPTDPALLQQQLAVAQAENAALQAQLEAGGGIVGGLDVTEMTEEQLQQAAAFRSIQGRAEELRAQVQALKDENDQVGFRVQVVAMHVLSGGKGAAPAGGGQAAQLLQQAKDKHKQLEQQIAGLHKKLKEAEAKSKAGGVGSDAQIKALELKLKEAEGEKRRELKQLGQELTKNTKGAASDVTKLESQLQRQTERADKAESELETTKSDFKDLQRQYDLIQKEFTKLQKQVGDVQEMHAELQQLRSISGEQAAQIKELEASYQAEKKLRKKYYNEIEDMKGKIRVFCRVRPFAKYEMEKGCKECVSVVDEYSVKGEKEFTYDRVFGGTCTQEEVYEDTERLIQSVVDGFNVCIFAYGQTGSGKTFTIQGNANYPGIAPRAINGLFALLDALDPQKYKFEANCYIATSAMREIGYLGCGIKKSQSRRSNRTGLCLSSALVDLLAPPEVKKHPPSLEIKKDSYGIVTIQGITMKKVTSADALGKIFEFGLGARHVSGTAMNAESSRSHLIFAVVVRIEDFLAEKVTSGKLSLIDLAGSERVSKSGVTKERLIEAKEINKSLTALGDVISALSSAGETFIPYRNHKLTQVMSDSLGGTAKTLMFVNISPADYNVDETVTSLMYASRVKLITNESSKHVESKQLARLKDRVNKLSAELEKVKKGETVDYSVLQEPEEATAQQAEGAPSADGVNDDTNLEEPEDLTF